MSATVLITTANKPPQGVPFLKMTNVAMRLITSKASVFFWAAHGAKRIVIADATGENILNSEDILLLKKISVEVEQINYCQNEELIKKRGKGYGEGELIKFALKNSKFLEVENNFFKCTGKLYCRNFKNIIEMINQNNIQNIFWRYVGEGDSMQQWIDTRFFFTTKEFCEKHLIPAYLKADETKAAAEFYCFNIIEKELESAKALRPLLSGFSGGTGDQYFDLSLGYLDINFPCWVDVK
jgi:hypothetical protein